ncbi:ACT domain-containing protein [Aquimarina sp. MMG015]|uniref:ACT domain-containing protein n=1 Tax=Aquimarina TaxID=290174 RepID=UPI0004818187|nr:MULTISPECIES: ACT domain-containing protein [Aquimarina]AXT56969.1 ACT domain-containing protein [Aquimarina sp. AD1]MBQ4801787.1 ACT domain-containing protein [Aquimarina sp. MMG015]RKN36959.1 ACT domain-containing protein [Aquimarina sp. AD1]
MAGEKNLTTLIQKMTPELQPGVYVFTTVKTTDLIERKDIICEFKEQKGITLVLKRETADNLNLKYEFIASWITLKILSSLDAIGFTAIFSAELAANEISCNVIAGYYHDHIFVNTKDAEKTIEILKRLSQNYPNKN